MPHPIDDLGSWTWNQLNDVIREASEEDCVDLLKKEMLGKGRKMFTQRIHSRLIRVRADRERIELETARHANLKPSCLKWLK